MADAIPLWLFRGARSDAPLGSAPTANRPLKTEPLVPGTGGTFGHTAARGARAVRLMTIDTSKRGVGPTG